MAGVLSSFVTLNRRVAEWLEPRLPHARVSPSRLYAEWAREEMAGLVSGALVLDIGSGRRCAVSDFVPAGVRLVAVDSSAEELRLNSEAGEIAVADVTERLPFGDASVDMIVSKHAMEHLSDTGAFVQEAARVLKPGGRFLHFFPCTFAPFAALNQVLPVGLGWRALAATSPETGGSRRFAARYDRCYRSGFVRLLRQHGLSPERTFVSWYQSHYFGFLAPLYLLSVGYELAVWTLQVEDLGAYLVVSARKGERGRSRQHSELDFGGESSINKGSD